MTYVFVLPVKGMMRDTGSENLIPLSLILETDGTGVFAEQFFVTSMRRFAANSSFLKSGHIKRVLF